MDNHDQKSELELLMEERKRLYGLSEDEEFDATIEHDPVFKLSQLRAGEVLTADDIAAIQWLISENDRLENADTDTYHRGRHDAFMEIGGSDLVTSVQLKDELRIAQYVRKAMDRLFPKEQRTQQ
ncbi:MAG: hypothetical protein AAAB13_20710 [Pseudomonas sp.]